MRNFQPGRVRNPANAPFQDAEARNARRFPAFLKQQLQAEADAEKRFPGIDEIQHRLHEAGFFQAGHRVAKRSNARQNGCRSLCQFFRVGGHGSVTAEEPERFDNALQVPGAIIKNGYQGASSFAFTIYHSIA
jgi:hypothetical protein